MGRFEEIFKVKKPLIAMCHLPGLPGRPRHDRSAPVDAIIEVVARDVEVLQAAGVDGLLFCNENDIPYQLTVGREVVAAMASVISRLRPVIGTPFGVDLLWDAQAALAVARATGAAFVREVFTGVYDSDMGLFAPQLGDIAGFQTSIGAGSVALFANVTPEFSRSVGARPVAERARGAAFMGVAAVLMSGFQAGMSIELADLEEAKSAAGEIPVLANTGVSHDNVEKLLSVADGAIVGTSLKVGGSTWNPVDPDRVARMMDLVGRVRSRSAGA
jgi:uncharacterized protein